MREDKNEMKNRPSQEENQVKNAVNTSDDAVQENNQFSLNDDRRVKVLSPGTLVVKRFLRNRLAVVGLVMLLCMFLFFLFGRPFESLRGR